MSKLALAAVVLVAIVAALFAWFVRADEVVEPLEAPHSSVRSAESPASEVLDPPNAVDASKSPDARAAVAPTVVAPARASLDARPPTGALEVILVDANDEPIDFIRATVKVASLGRSVNSEKLVEPPKAQERALLRSNRVTFEALHAGPWSVACAVEGTKDAASAQANVTAGARAVVRVRVERKRQIMVNVFDDAGRPALLDHAHDGPPLGEPFTVMLTRAPCVVGAMFTTEPRPLRQTCTPFPGSRPSGFVVDAPAVRSSWIVLLHGARAVAVAPAPTGDGEVLLHVASSELVHGFGSLALCVLDATTSAPIPSVRVLWTSPGLKQRAIALDERGCGALERVPLVAATLQIVADGYLTARPAVQLAKDEARDLGVVRLVAAGSIVGRVTSPGAVFVKVLAWRLVDGEPTLAVEASVASDGAFGFDGLVPGNYLVTAKTGHAPSLEDVRRGERPDSAIVVVAGGVRANVTLHGPVSVTKTGTAR